jgi:LmbE family N-acetylglucosaminyl deacetylase
MRESGSPLRVIAVGAHPDDCEFYFGGTAAKLAAQGHQVKFVSVTNGDAGHHRLAGLELAARRKSETEEAARRLGIAAWEVLDHHDGLLLADLATRLQIIRCLRQWQADIVLTHRFNDYHPDHRYTSQLVQDSAYLVLVPNICPEVPVLRRNPVYLYFEDDFQKPAAFTPDVVVAIDDVWSRKIDALDAHASQFYEWLPWVDWNGETVPPTPEERRAWLEAKVSRPPSPSVRRKLAERYGAECAERIRYAEAFELCEYGRRPTTAELNELLPR